VGVVLRRKTLARLNAGEGDTLVLTESPDGGFRVTPSKDDFAHQMALARISPTAIATRWREWPNEGTVWVRRDVVLRIS